MTIIFGGHVENIANGGTPGGVRLTIQPESRRNLAPLVLEAFKGEADAYRPGQGIEVRIIPVSYITLYREIAETLGIKGEIWLAPEVIARVKHINARLNALRTALGE